jgi:polyisoprenoid-binding protein YceI
VLANGLPGKEGAMKVFTAFLKATLIFLSVFPFASGVCAKPVEWYYDPVGTFGLLTMNHSNLFNMYTIIDEASATGFIDDDKFTDSRFEIRAKVSSFYVHPAPTIEQLQSKDFFYDEKYPEIVLRTVSIHETGGGYSATVELTIRGVTRKEVFGLEVMKKVPFEGTTWRAFRFKGSINRHDYGMTWREPEMLDDQLYGDIFELEFSAEFTDKEFAQKEGQEIVLPHIEYGKAVYP